jgi:endoglucanase
MSMPLRDSDSESEQDLTPSMLERRQFLRRSGSAGIASAAAAILVAVTPRLPAEPLGMRVMANQLGYLPQASKVLTVQLPPNSAADAGKSFRVHSMMGGKQVLEGQLSEPQLDALSGDRVQLADVSAVHAPGMYTLTLEHGAKADFGVGEGLYQHALWLTMRGFSGQRCGCEVNLGNGYQHPPCHLKDAFHASSGRTGPFQNHGGWHDAGDYGRYMVNSGLSTGTLLWAWELFRDALQPLQLQIPESGGKLPDYLAELRWNLDWMLALQDGDGGVWHKQTSLQFSGFVMPQDDGLVSYVIGTGAAPYKVTTATADLAAVAAIAARVYREYDSAFAERCLDAARRAWTWAMAHPESLFEKNPPEVSTGAYEDAHSRDELMWASAELWRTTGEPQYEEALLHKLRDPSKPIAISAPSWSSVESMAWWTYALAGRGGSVVNEVHAATVAAADALVEQSKRNGYGQTLAETDYIWGSNGVAANHGLLLLIADRFHANAEYRAAAVGNLHYLLGRNCFGVSWVTQLGANPFQHPHHRPSVADGIEAPWPGLLSGGPNRMPGDPVMQALPKQPPMRMWVDQWQAFSVNEVAINWNAPLVFLLAGVQR